MDAPSDVVMADRQKRQRDGVSNNAPAAAEPRLEEEARTWLIRRIAIGAEDALQETEALQRLSDKELQFKAQVVLLADYEDPMSRYRSWRIHELIFDDLKSPQLTPEAEKYLLEAHRKEIWRPYVKALFKLLYEGKAPSYPDGGVAAIVAFLCQVEWDPSNTGSKEEVFTAIEQFGEEVKIDIVSQFGAQCKKGNDSQISWVFFDHYLDQARQQGNQKEVLNLLSLYASVQPQGCACWFRYGRKFARPEKITYIGTILETLAALPLGEDTLDAVKRVSQKATSVSSEFQSRFAAPLYRIFDKVAYPNIDYPAYENILHSIIQFTIRNDPRIPEEVLVILEKLLAIPIPFNHWVVAEAQEEMCTVLEKLIDTDAFLRLWPHVQRQLLRMEPSLEKRIQKFLIQVAYRHPSAAAIEEMQIQRYASRFHSGTVKEEDLWPFALVAHYAPHLLPQTLFTLERLRETEDETHWKCIALTRQRWSQESWRHFAEVQSKMGYSYNRYAQLIEVTLRLDFDLAAKKLDTGLHYMLNSHHQNVHFKKGPLFYHDTLLVLLETIAAKVQEGKISPPLTKLGELLELIPPSERQAPAVAILTEKHFLTP